MFYICWARRIWLNSDTLEQVMWEMFISFQILYVKKIWHARENNNGKSKLAYKWVCECYQCFLWCKLNLINGAVINIHTKTRILRKLAMFAIVKTHNLPNFSFSSNETMRNYYLWTWYVAVASWVAKRLKT